MNSTPWLSVVVPVYNGAEHLGAALDSVAAASDPAVEVICSDDGSTDGSVRLIDDYAARGLVRRLTGPGVGNWVANANKAVASCRGEWVTFLHQDDLWLDGRLGAIRRSLQRHPECRLHVNPSRFVDRQGRFVGNWRLPCRSVDGRIDARRFLEQLLVQNFIAMPAPVFSRAAFEAVGGMDESLWFTADWDLWLKLTAGAGVGLSAEPSTAFRLHPLSQTVTRAAAGESVRAQIATVIDRHLPRIEDAAARSAVERAARFSCEINACLAAAATGRPIEWTGLLLRARRLGVGAAWRFARDSRLLERSVSRLRVGLNRGGD